MRTRAVRRKGRKHLGWICLLAFGLLAAAWWAEAPMEELLWIRVRQQAQENANRAVQEAAAELLETCDPAATLTVHRNDSGQIQSLTTDPVVLTRIQTTLHGLVQDRLDADASCTMKIPLGTLTGWSLLRERGPKVTVRFAAISAARCVVRNHFSEAGVNQTLHEVWLDAELTVYPMLRGAETETITVSCCLAQTVIVGQVPSVALR